MWDYIDIHSHLNFAVFNDDREAVIEELKKQNIATITVGTDYKTSVEAADLANRHENLFATIGVHPADNASESFSKDQFTELVKNRNIVAIGECGLDYFRLKGEIESEKKRQRDDFEKQIEFAVIHDKPLMIHCRDAYDDCLAILNSKKREHGDKLRGNFHFFTSPIDVARKCLDVGFTVSFTGPITFGTHYDEIVAFVPLEKMMAETDAPFAAPAPYRGKRNQPAYVKEVVLKIAQVKGTHLDIVKKQLLNNAIELFLTKNLTPGL